jgi:hypothetical protein
MGIENHRPAMISPPFSRLIHPLARGAWCGAAFFLVACWLNVGSLQAQEPAAPTSSQELSSSPEASIPAPPRTLGLYEVQPGLRAVLNGKKAPATAVARVGQVSIVREAVPQGRVSSEAQAPDRITPGTVVRNRQTRELGYYSGQLRVLLRDEAQGAELSSLLGSSIQHRFSRGRLLVLQAPPGTDLIQLRQQALDTGWVLEARLDVAERRYRTR